MKFLGETVKTIRGISPQNVDTSTTIEGEVIDRIGYYGVTVTAITGATTGTVNSCVFQLQHGNQSDGSDMENIEGAYVDIVDGDSEGEINVRLDDFKRYIRVVVTTDLEESSSITVGATITLG